MFSGGAVRELTGAGAPRWKQRALYDAIKDTLPGSGLDARLSRVATHDRIGKASLGEMLDGAAPIDVVGIRTLFENRAA